MQWSRILLILLCLAVLVAFAGLIPLGTWQDDYLNLHAYQQQGITFLIERLRHWSPRPLSESLIYLYALAVRHFGSALIGAFLAPFWILLAAALWMPCWLSRRNRVVALTLLAMLLLGHPVAEFFYWPDGAAAYLPTLAAAGWLLAVDWADWGRNRYAFTCTVVALLAAAASSEVGAMFVMVYCLLLLVGGGSVFDRRALWLLVSLAFSLCLLALQYMGRVSQANELIGDPAVAHHPFATLLHTLKALPFDLLRGDALRHKATAAIEGLVVKTLFFMGLYFSLSARRIDASAQTQRLRIVLIASLLITATLTLAAAFYHFGAACCERHETLRQDYVLIALASLATLMAAIRPSRHANLGVPLLLAAVLIPSAVVAPRLLSEYRAYTVIAQARQATWDSGRAAGGSMIYWQTKPNLTGNFYLQPGMYRRDSDSGSDARAQWMLIFFNKSTLTATVAADAGNGGPQDHP